MFHYISNILKNTFIISRYAYYMLIAVSLSSCAGRNEKTGYEDIKKASGIIERADRFSLEKKTGYSILTVNNPWQGATNIHHKYYLVKRGVKIPGEADPADVIPVPVSSVICTSTTHLAMISLLGEEETISGMSGTDYIYDEELIKRVDAGIIKDIGYDNNLNNELILKISPDLIMMYGIGSESAGYTGKIEELGVKVIFNADYLETDPLAKTEWIKLFGALYCKENLADSIYSSIADRYDDIKSMISHNIKTRPKIMLGLPYKDTWFISPGNSYINELISDAGGDYLWKDTRSEESMPVAIENVYLHAMEADYWLNIGNVDAPADILALDTRLKELPCFQNGNLYSNNRRVSVKGGNDYWESGSINPHIILRDIASIIHPELFTVSELFYYKRID